MPKSAQMLFIIENREGNWGVGMKVAVILPVEEADDGRFPHPSVREDCHQSLTPIYCPSGLIEHSFEVRRDKQRIWVRRDGKRVYKRRGSHKRPYITARPFETTLFSSQSGKVC